jgi:hypothetical protein
VELASRWWRLLVGYPRFSAGVGALKVASNQADGAMRSPI